VLLVQLQKMNDFQLRDDGGDYDSKMMARLEYSVDLQMSYHHDEVELEELVCEKMDMMEGSLRGEVENDVGDLPCVDDYKL